MRPNTHTPPYGLSAIAAMHYLVVGFLSLCLLFISSRLQAQQDTARFERQVYVSAEGDSLLYRILYPENYDQNKKYPLVLFMHGAGERGQDNKKQLTHGSGLFLDVQHRQKYPAIVVFPQCPEDKYWVDINLRKKLFAGQDLDFEEVNASPTKEMELVMQLHDKIIREEKVDKKRLYIIGLSMGSFGTFEILARYPERFAAAIPICGGGNVAAAKRYGKHTALWITHGAKDEVVPVKYSRRVYGALKQQGADVHYTEFPETNHDAWGPTFAMPELLP